jgi:hypothetical protein
MSKFYRYNQNNSSGSFSGDYVNIIIEAEDSDEADSIAESNGVYFNGVEDEIDCDCCGDRWSRAWTDWDKEPSIYSDKHNPNGKEMLSSGLKSIIIYKNGKQEIFKV